MNNYLQKPIIFFGFGRCGSTIISNIIFQHHKLAWLSQYQQNFPSSAKINLLRNLFDNQFWRIRKKNQLDKFSFLNKYIFRPGEAYRFWNTVTGRDFALSFLYGVEERGQKRDKIRSFFVDLVKYQNRERLSFKITGPPRLTYLNSLFPDAKFIYIRRNPLPNIRSLLNVKFYQDRKHELTWDQQGIYTGRELEKIEKWKYEIPSFIAAIQYYKVNEIYEKEKERLDLEERMLEVSYESFTDKTESTVNKIMKFLKLERDDAIQGYLNANEIYNGNRKEEYYISSELDEQVLKIATKGV